jgi:hypothetical protein
MDRKFVEFEKKISKLMNFNSEYIVIYYIVESEILRNSQWYIFHIFTSEDIDHVTFSIYTILYKQNITRWLEDMTLFSRVKNNILLTRCARS